MINRNQALVFAFGLLTVGCTSALAPENEGSAVADITDLEKTSDATTTNTNAASPTPTPNPTVTPPPPGSDGTGDGSTDGAAEEGEVLGTIANQVTDLAAFSSKSVYALSMPANGLLSITVLDVEARDTMFRKVKTYTCEPCDGADDVHCAVGATAKTVSITFMKSFTGSATHKVTDQGFPKGDANSLAGNYTADQDSGLTLSNSLNPAATGNKGSVNFTAGKRPAQKGDAFEVTVDLEFGGGAKYKAKLSGKVYELPTNPTPPTCAADEYLDVEFED